MRWQFGQRPARREDDRQALLAASVPLEQVDALLPDSGEAQAFELLPQAWPIWRVWLGMQTQWRVGMAGATGLDYGALPVVERRTGLPRARWEEAFECLQEMEREALGLMSKGRK